MTRFGYFLSSEELGPDALLDQARVAEDARFEALWKGFFDFYRDQVLPRSR